MAKKFGFYGASDDLFMLALDGRDMEEIYPPEMYLLKSPDGQLVGSAVYGQREGVWSIGIEPVDEGVPLPDWPIRMSLSERGYSTLLEIECPDDTSFFVINSTRED